jgi:hypothetical protein
MREGLGAMKYSDFVEAYKDFRNKAKTALVEDEGIVLIHETDWTQVLLAHTPLKADTITLIVEVSLPSWVHELSLPGTAGEHSLEYTPQLQRVLSEQVHHLEYLLKLSHAGFHLAIIAEEGFWSAWTLLQDTPTRNLFLLLSPPEVIL